MLFWACLTVQNALLCNHVGVCHDDESAIRNEENNLGTCPLLGAYIYGLTLLM